MENYAYKALFRDFTGSNHAEAEKGDFSFTLGGSENKPHASSPSEKDLSAKK